MSSAQVHDERMRVLVVEDNRTLADRIADGLRDAGMAVDVTYDGAGALEKAGVVEYDVIVLDRDLPRVHGDTVCAALPGSPARILMLDGRRRDRGPRGGTGLGRRRLPAQAVRVRRTGGTAAFPGPPGSHAAAGAPPGRTWCWTGSRRRVSRSGRPISLTRKELGVLEELLTADGAVVSAERLLEKVWDEHADPFSNTVSVTMARLRRKLGAPAGDRDRGRLRIPVPVTSRRRSVRARIALACAGLFLVTGGALIAITYLLVDQNLATTVAATTSGVTPDQTLLRRCKSDVPQDANLATKCRQAFQAGAAAGAKQQNSAALAELLTWWLISLGALTVLAGGTGWAVAGRVLRPVRAITDAARRASEHNLGDRLALHGPHDELKELADTFDGMLDRLDAAFASQRRFVANASHELRTPLTVMRTAIDVTLAKPNRDREQLETMAVEVRQAVDRAEELIGALLTLARSDRGMIGREFVDLATAVEDTVDTVDLAGITVRTDLEPAELLGDRVLLERMVANLVQNAARHNVPGGWIRVTTGRSDGSVRLVVANSGERLPPDVVPSLFEPFRRLHDRVGWDQGVGLGLSIVRSVVTSHHGVVRGEAPAAGGLEITVTLPVPDSQPAQVTAR